MDFKCNDDSFDSEMAVLKKHLEDLENHDLTIYQKLLGIKRFFNIIKSDSYGEETGFRY
jgi:hypothetical protein